MRNELSLDLSDLSVEQITPMATEPTSLEELMSGHGMDEMAASVLPASCCSCSVPCCCCC